MLLSAAALGLILGAAPPVTAPVPRSGATTIATAAIAPPPATSPLASANDAQAQRRRRNGLGLVTVGLVALASSGLLYVLDGCEESRVNDCQRTRRLTAALAIGIPGASFVLAGTTLSIVGLVGGRDGGDSLTTGVRLNVAF